MRKFLSRALVFIVAACSVFMTAGCTKSPFETYFNEFSSVSGFTAAEELLRLPKGVTVDGYFENADRFVIKEESGLEDEDKNPIYLYGIATRTEILIAPAFLYVYDISGDYATVARLSIDENNQITQSFGLIRIYGKELYSDMTTFQHTAASDVYLPIRFTGDYIAIFGGRYADRGADAFVFYDRDMNEAFTVKADLFYKFTAAEGYLVAFPDETKAEFYKTDKKDADGLLAATDVYEPFSEEDLTGRTCSVKVDYLGNGWFLRTAEAASSTAFTGYNVLLNETAQKNPFLKIVSDRYDANGKIAYNNQNLMPVLAVNQYNRAEMRDLASVQNQTEITAEEDGKPAYRFPVYPASELVKSGYTVVYSYFYIDEESKAVDVSFAVLSGTAQSPAVISSLYMPLLFVDGTGFEVDSPYFDPSYSSAGIYDRKGKLTVVEAEKKEYSYASLEAYHDGISIVKHVDLLTGSPVEATYAAYSGQKMIASYGRYHEFTPYFSGYATASRYDAKTKKRTYFCVDESGAERELSDVRALKNGVYTVAAGEGENARYGLYSNAGAALLTDTSFLQVYEMFLKDGKFMETIAFTIEDGRGVIYRLK